MIINSKLSLFQAQVKDVDNFSSQIMCDIYADPLEYKEIIFLLEKTVEFCNTYFTTFIDNLTREKRLLDFETPNRFKAVYEYTINNKHPESDFYYLFTPSCRLSWLKIFIDEERVSVASKEVVKEKFYSVLKVEIDKILINYIGVSKDDVLTEIYDNLSGLPCFLEFNKVKHLNDISFQIKLEFYDSIKIEFMPAWYKTLFYPLDQNKIQYTYAPIKKNISSWLYLKSPKNFELYCDELDKTTIEISDTNDPEIVSLVWRGGVQIIDILIKVPSSLQKWFLFLYRFIVVFILYFVLSVLDKFNALSGFHWYKSICFVNNLFCDLEAKPIRDISIALAAAIIATRGWLIIEETLLRRISIHYTWFLMVLFVINILVLFLL